MKLERMEINKLRPAEYNPRKELKPEDKEYQKIKNSIEEFGYVDPILVNKDLTIIGGHQRLNVLKDMGYNEVDVIMLDLDKTKEKALNVALNKITGEWDKQKLEELLIDLEENDYDLTLTGFENYEIEDLMTPILDVDDLSEEFSLKDGDREPIITMSITLSDEQAERVNEAISIMKKTNEFKEYENINKNSNGNALYMVVEEWLSQQI